MGLLQLGAGEVGTTLPAVFSCWRELGALFVNALCTAPDAGFGRGSGDGPVPPREQLLALAAAAPPMTGAEYLTAAVLESLWQEILTSRLSRLDSPSRSESAIDRLRPRPDRRPPRRARLAQARAFAVPFARWREKTGKAHRREPCSREPAGTS